ncbi:hypothetical protein KY304_00765 [Candidatus Woesearchaeota archaeon]|nr:hypothetical protein [Candidatus Woesearchaeota archaeon]
MNWIEFKDRFSRFGWFGKKEVYHLVLLVLAFAFIFSFDMWGGSVFDAQVGLKNLFVSFVLVGIVVLVHHFVQRIVCVLFGFRPFHSFWWPGLIISLFVAFISNGTLLFFMGSVFKIQMRDIHRLGWQRYGLNVKQQGLIAMSGNLALVLLIGFLKLFSAVPDSFLSRMIGFSILFILFNVIPWPHSDGFCMFFGSRLYFVFLLCALIGFLIFLTAGFLIAVFLGLVMGAIVWILFYWFFEKEWG